MSKLTVSAQDETAHRARGLDRGAVIDRAIVGADLEGVDVVG
jgi:hypothetical protein